MQLKHDNIRYTALNTGIEVVSESLKDYPAVSVGIWLKTGSSDESANTNGVSHYFEHMVFKGSRSYSALEQVRQIECRGGYINAYTTREYTCFYARVIPDELEKALDILADMVHNPLIPEVECEREREVIIEEILSGDDSPEDLSHDLLMESLFGPEGYGLPIAGTVESVKKLAKKELDEHHQMVLKKTPIVVAAAGCVEHSQLLQAIEKCFVDKQTQSPKGPRVYAPLQQKTILMRSKDIQQSVVTLGAIAPQNEIKDRAAANILNSILGDGMSSRLFQKIREEMGLVYSIYSSLDFFHDFRMLNLSFSCDSTKVLRALEACQENMAQMLKEGVESKAFADAQGAVSGAIQLGAESSSNRVNRLARNVLTGNPLKSMDEILDTYRKLTPDDVNQSAKQCFKESSWSVGVVGPQDKELAEKPIVDIVKNIGD